MEDNKEMDMSDMEEGNLFWSLKIPVGEEIDIPQPSRPDCNVRITSATFGDHVNKNSRTVVNCIQYETETSRKTSPICILSENKCETIQLDLLFSELVGFKLTGRKPSEVTLNGYLQADNLGDMMDAGEFEDMEEAKIEEELRNRERKRKRNLENNDDDDDDDDNNDNEGENSDDVDNNDNDNNDSDNNDDDNDENDDDEPVKKKRKLNDSKKTVEKPAPSKQNKPQSKQKGKKDMITMKNGIKYRDMKIGNGALIKKNDNLKVKYVGQLEDKSVFDKAINSEGFTFKFGAGEVIKGWDIGLKGMKVGGKRRLVIPSKFGYGKEGSEPTIPPNAQLTFTIEVCKVL